MKLISALTVAILFAGLFGCHSSSDKQPDNSQQAPIQDTLKTAAKDSIEPLVLPDTSNNCAAGLFLRIPMDKSENISIENRDTLLGYHDCTLIADTDITEVLHLDTLTKTYMVYEDSYTTGQAAQSVTEIRRFPKKNGGYILLFSRFGGTHGMDDQETFKIYDVNGRKITESKDSLLPPDLSIRSFVKKGTPDSILTIIDANFGAYYDIPMKGDTIRFSAEFSTNDNTYDQYFTDTQYEFVWDGERFKKVVSLAGK
jgi:hypothetical protein